MAPLVQCSVTLHDTRCIQKFYKQEEDKLSCFSLAFGIWYVVSDSSHWYVSINTFSPILKNTNKQTAQITAQCSFDGQ